jgi:hypothetical protein
MSRFLALTCEALARSIYRISAETNHTVSVRLFGQGLHNRPKNLRTILQEEIDSIPEGEYDAVLLVYGMCGTSTVGLTARDTQLVIPRAHDCITLYLGSRERYQEEFERHPGTYWYSVDYIERADKGASVALGAAGIEETEAQYEEYVKKFGQETADYLIEEMRKWSQHYTRAAFIDTGLGNTEAYEQLAKDKAQRDGWVYERISGNRRLLEILISGDWPNDEFLIVDPGHTIRQDIGEKLVKSVPAGS